MKSLLYRFLSEWWRGFRGRRKGFVKSRRFQVWNRIFRYDFPSTPTCSLLRTSPTVFRTWVRPFVKLSEYRLPSHRRTTLVFRLRLYFLMSVRGIKGWVVEWFMKLKMNKWTNKVLKILIDETNKDIYNMSKILISYIIVFNSKKWMSYQVSEILIYIILL